MNKQLIPLIVSLCALPSICLAGGPAVKPLSPWQTYLGAFSGIYSNDFGYGSTYGGTGSINVQGNHINNNDVFQYGPSLGGQIGFNYHFHSPYYVGAVFSVMMNANKARLAITPDDVSAGSGVVFTINHQFRINSNLDLAAVIGADITAHTQIYGKLGGTRSLPLAPEPFLFRHPFHNLSNTNTSGAGTLDWV